MTIHRPTIPVDVDDSKPLINGHNPTRRPKKKRAADDVTSATSSSSSAYPINNSNSNSLYQRGIRIPNKRKFHFRRNRSDVEAIAFPLGMSIAAVFAQVLEQKDLVSDSASVEYLSTICTSAVRESLTNVFGEKFDAFAINFEKSFGSTLNTIRLVRSEINNGRNRSGNSHVSNCHPDKIPPISSITGECSSRRDDTTKGCHDSLDHGGALQHFKRNEDIEDHVASECGNQELPMQGIASWELARTDPQSLSMQSVFKKSVSEQTRANDLKSLELSLTMKKMQMMQTRLALHSDSNVLEKFKLSLGISRTSFKVEKFKTQVEETKHGELLKELADYLVTGLIIMSCCLCCGVYTFSLDNLRELTKSCYPPEGAKSWWKPMASLNLGWQTLSCQVQVYSRIIFGGLIIGAVAVTLIQRSAIARQGMPITSIVLLLGILGGFVGKICVDTLGGNGYIWLIFWEVLCFVHFFSITFTPFLYSILCGAVQVCQGAEYRILFPFWVRRCLFRLFLLLLPVFCGLLPFASGKTWWEDHISIWIKNRWLATFAEPYDDGFHE